jgi:hypothetical protein
MVPTLGELARECRLAKARHRIAPDWLEVKPAGDRRWTARSAVSIDADFRPRWRRRFGVHVENLSTHGCRITDPGHLIPGTYSWIILPTLESRYARVAWCDSNAVGLDFVEPLHRAVVDMIIRRTAARRNSKTGVAPFGKYVGQPPSSCGLQQRV